MKASKTILSILLAMLLLVQTLPATVAADSPNNGDQGCTVDFVAAGNSEGSETADIENVITLPSTVSNMPDGYEVSGWVESRFTETTEEPVFYVPGADYTVTGNATLYALFTRTEENGEDSIYKLTDDLAVGGKYVITIEEYAVGNTVYNTNYNHNVTGQTVTIDSSTDTLTVPSGVDVNTILYEIESGNDTYGWIFKNVGNGQYLTLGSDEFLIVGNTPLAWLYQNHNLDNQVDTEGYYYLSLCSDKPAFTTNKNKKDNVKLYQKIPSYVTFYMTDQAMPMFAYHSLVLSGQIGVNFYMDLPEIDGVNYTESYMTFEISGKGKVSADPVPYNSTQTIAGSTYYGFTCYVNSNQMADTITATFHYGDGLTISEEYSIAQYIASFDTYAETHPDEFDAETIKLVHAVADYGHYVQPFLSDVRGWTIGSGDDQYAEMDRVYTNEYDIDTVKAAVADYGIQSTMSTDIEGIRYSLLMDSGTAIYLYFKPVADYDGSFTVSVGGNPEAATKLKDGRYLVKIKKIGAHKLGDPYTVVVTTANGDSTVTVSALSYVKGLLDAEAYKDNTNAQDAAAAIYYYHVAAQAYKTKHP